MEGVKKHIDPWETNAGGGGSRRYSIHWLPGVLCEVMSLEGSAMRLGAIKSDSWYTYRGLCWLSRR